MINWFVVNSDSIKKIGHDATNDCLYINFDDGGEYTVYTNVSLYAFYHFSLANSIDDYYRQVIKINYSIKQ